MNRRAQRGLSLVELMVAMVISLILLAGVIQIYIANSQTNRIQQANARVQENGRFAVQFLARDVRGAGYSGCVPTELLQISIKANNADEDDIPGTADSIEGFDDVAAGNAWGAVAGTDIVRLTGAMNANVKLAGNMTTNNANIQVTGNPNNWEADDLLFIADCENGDLFRATNVSQNNGGGVGITIAHASSSNSGSKLSKIYGQDARVLQFQDVVYFIRDTGRTAPDGEAILGLYREIDGGTPQELIEGVADLQVVYGQDTDESGDIDRYVTADALAGDDWAQVLAVRMQLLTVSTEPNVLDDPQTYFIDGETIGDDPAESGLVDDRRLRRVFTTTAVIRNRTP